MSDSEEFSLSRTLAEVDAVASRQRAADIATEWHTQTVARLESEHAQRAAACRAVRAELDAERVQSEAYAAKSARAAGTVERARTALRESAKQSASAARAIVAQRSDHERATRLFVEKAEAIVAETEQRAEIEAANFDARVAMTRDEADAKSSELEKYRNQWRTLDGSGESGEGGVEDRSAEALGMCNSVGVLMEKDAIKLAELDELTREVQKCEREASDLARAVERNARALREAAQQLHHHSARADKEQRPPASQQPRHSRAESHTSQRFEY